MVGGLWGGEKAGSNRGLFFLAGVVGWCFANNFMACFQHAIKLFVARAGRSKMSGIEHVNLSYGGLLRRVATIFGFRVRWVGYEF